MTSFMFNHGGDARELAIDRKSSLGDVQQRLCRLYRKTFPMMKAVLIVDDTTFDEFMQKPFVNYDEGTNFDVEFYQTDDPHYYDVADRVVPKITLEEELQYEDEVNRGEMPEDTCIKSWVSSSV